MKLRTTLLSLFALAVLPGTALAENLIKVPGAHPRYSAELEPHLLLDFPRGVGIGGRATFNLVPEGFISSLNDSVGLGVGADFSIDRDADLVVPLVMQWNFWFTREWSAFGEPGLALRTGKRNHLMPHIGAGGRYQFNSDIALTMRVGFPISSIGVSFFL